MTDRSYLNPLWDGRFSLVGIALLFLAIFFVVPSEYHRRGDLLAYRVAQTAIDSGGNPYNPSDLRVAQKTSAGFDAPAAPVWNPPLFFIVLGPLLNLPPPFMPLLLPFLSVLAGLMICWTGWGLAAHDQPFPRCFAVAALAVCLPWWSNIFLGQWSILIAGLVAAGIFAFSRRYDVCAGVLLSSVILKPHPFWLPMAVIGFLALRERRLRFLVTIPVTLAVLSIIAESVYPGIHARWILRESWPTAYLTATVPTLMRVAWSAFGIPGSPFVLWFMFGGSLLAGLLIYWRIIQRTNARQLRTLIPHSLAISVLFAPYGFLFDQSIVLLLEFVLIAVAYSSGEPRVTRMMRTLLVGNIAFAVLFLVDLWSLSLWWYAFPAFFIFVQLLFPPAYLVYRPPAQLQTVSAAR
jgi:Glycosyltransferase family 87